jgi:hypothetical protein
MQRHVEGIHGTDHGTDAVHARLVLHSNAKGEYMSCVWHFNG